MTIDDKWWLSMTIDQRWTDGRTMLVVKLLSRLKIPCFTHLQLFDMRTSLWYLKVFIIAASCVNLNDKLTKWSSLVCVWRWSSLVQNHISQGNAVKISVWNSHWFLTSMAICNNWGEGSGLDEWDVDCNFKVEGR